MTDERISELGDKTIKSTQSLQPRENRLRRQINNRASGTRGTIRKKSQKRIFWHSRGKAKREWVEKVF